MRAPSYLPAEWGDVAKIPPALALVGLHLADALTNAIPLRLGHG